MLFLGIDLHRKQVTVSLRNEDGDAVLRRQVSTRWPKLEEFRGQLHEALAPDEKYVAVFEVCGFYDWLVNWLQQDQRCHQVLLIQPLGRSANKTDRRDANALSELLWVNRERVLRRDRIRGVRTVLLPSVEQQVDRRLTQVRERLVWRRTQTLNQIHKILRRHNLEWEQPTKSFQTRKVTQWLKSLPLEPMDRLAINQLLVQWRLWAEPFIFGERAIGAVPLLRLRIAGPRAAAVVGGAWHEPVYRGSGVVRVVGTGNAVGGTAVADGRLKTTG